MSCRYVNAADLNVEHKTQMLFDSNESIVSMKCVLLFDLLCIPRLGDGDREIDEEGKTRE